MKTHTRFLLTLVAICLFINQSSAQDSWTKKANFPGAGRAYASCFSIGGRAYVGGGDTANSNTSLPIINDFWEYNPDSNKWTRKANIPLSPRIGAICFSIGNKGFIGCGDGGNDFWEYDPAKNTWSRKADVPGSSRLYPVSFSIGSKGYTGMGFVWGVGNVLNDFWEYDTAANKWTRMANFPGVPKVYAIGFSIGNKGFAGTGIDSGFQTGVLTAYNDFWQYDPAKDKWTQKASIGNHGRYDAIGFGLANQGYIGFGFIDSTGIENDMWTYDTTANKWTQKSYCDTGYSVVGAFAFNIGNKGYVGSGQDVNGNFSNDFYQYTNHTSSINESKKQVDFEIYPNPGSGNFVLNSSSPIESYQVCDMSGKEIYKDVVNTIGNSIDVNLSLPDGLYLVRVISNKGTAVKKVLVAGN